MRTLAVVQNRESREASLNVRPSRERPFVHLPGDRLSSAKSGRSLDDILPPMIEDTAHWPSGMVRIVWHGPEETELPLTGVHGLCFYQGKVLVCNISGRGLTIPGGHIDEGETAPECLTREASEEACVGLANLRLLGFIEADHRANSEFDGRYPLRSVQAMYRADVVEVRDFDFRHESTDRRFVTIGELAIVHHEWNAVLQEALDVAVETDGR